MNRQELYGLDPALDSAFKQADQIKAEVESLKGQCHTWQVKFFPLLPRDMAHWREISLDSFAISDIPRFIEDGLVCVAGGRDGKLDAEALAVLGQANGDLWSALSRLRTEVGPRLRVLGRAFELLGPKLEKAQEEALKLLAERARPEHNKIRRRIALAIVALGEALKDDRDFRASLPPGAGPYLPTPPPKVQQAGGLAGVGPLYGSSVGNYLRRALADGLLKTSEVPDHWRESLAITDVAESVPASGNKRRN